MLLMLKVATFSGSLSVPVLWVHTRNQQRRIGHVAYLAFWLILVGGKAALMYGVLRLARAQGRSPWLPFIASIFCASIVFFALFIKGRAEHLTSPQNSN